MNMDKPEESVRGNTMLKGPVQYCLTIHGDYLRSCEGVYALTLKNGPSRLMYALVPCMQAVVVTHRTAKTL